MVTEYEVTYVGDEPLIHHVPPNAECPPISFPRSVPVNLHQHLRHLFLEYESRRYLVDTGSLNADGSSVKGWKKGGSVAKPITVEKAARLDALVQSIGKWHQREAQNAIKNGVHWPWTVAIKGKVKTTIIKTDVEVLNEEIAKVCSGTAAEVLAFIERSKIDDFVLDSIETREKAGKGRVSVLTAIKDTRKRLRAGIPIEKTSDNPISDEIDRGIDELLGEGVQAGDRGAA